MRYAIALILLCSIFACGSPTAPVRHPAIQAPSHDGEPCTTADGRSGYMVTSGFSQTCQPY